MPLRLPRRTAALIAAPALISGGVLAAAPVAKADDSPAPAYRGSAMALAAKATLGGTTLLDQVLPGGVKFPSGGAGELLSLPGDLSKIATLRVLDESSKVSKEDILHSNALAASLSVLQGLVGAELLNADCSADGMKVAGDSSVRGLTLLGTKIPIDLGKPNFTAEIPNELSKLVQGGIYVNEQNRSSDGTLLIRALHVHLTVAPEAVATALRSTLPQVRALAARVTDALEAATGKTLDQLLHAHQSVPNGRHGALSDDVRREASTPEAARPAAAAHSGGAAAAARPAVPAATRSKADTAAATDSSTAATSQQSAATTTTRKSDDAAVARQSQDSDASADERAMDARAERGSKSDAPDPQPAAAASPSGSTAPQQQSDDPDPAPASDSQPVVEQHSPGATYGAPATEAKPDQAAVSRETARAATRAEDKSDGSELTARQRAAAPTSALPPAVSTAGGLLGVDVVVSQVSCAGAQIVQAAAARPPAALPHTGANGHAMRDLGVAGLGLIVSGATAVALVRRRRLTSGG